jgi:hypothetical protein
VHRQLKRKHVTLLILLDEYVAANPSGCYSLVDVALGELTTQLNEKQGLRRLCVTRRQLLEEVHRRLSPAERPPVLRPSRP